MEIEPLRGRLKLVAKRLGLSVAVDQIGITAVNPSPPQLATDGVEDDLEGFTFWKVKHGIRWTGMPSWKDTLTDQQIWTLALFLKHMDKLPPAAQEAWQKVKN